MQQSFPVLVLETFQTIFIRTTKGEEGDGGKAGPLVTIDTNSPGAPSCPRCLVQYGGGEWGGVGRRSYSGNKETRGDVSWNAVLCGGVGKVSVCTEPGSYPPFCDLL